MKRLIAIILSAMMLVGLMPGLIVSGSAAEEAVYVRTALKDLKYGDKFVIVQEDYSVAVTAPKEYGSYCFVEEVDIIDGRIINPSEQAVWELDMISRDSRSVVGCFLQNGGALSRYTDYVWPDEFYSGPMSWPIEPNYDYFNMVGPYDTWRLSLNGTDEYECIISNVEIDSLVSLFDSNYYESEWEELDPNYVVGVGVYEVGWRRSDFVIYVLEGAGYEDNIFVPVSIWDLRDGDEIVIVDESQELALSEPAYSGSYIYPMSVEIIDGKLINPSKKIIWEFDLLSKGSSYIEGAFYRDGKVLSKKSDSDWTPGPDFDPNVDSPPDPTYDHFNMNGNYPTWKLEMSRKSIRACTISNVHLGKEICFFDINYIYDDPLTIAPEEYVVGCGPYVSDLWDLDIAIYAKRDPAVEAERVMRHTLNLESDISLRLWVDKLLIEKNHIDTELMSIEYTIFDSVAGTATERSGKISDYEEYGDYYVFTIDGLTAVDMNAKIKSTLLGTTYDDAVVELCTDVYSIVTYAYSQMDKEQSSQKLKTVCADLLRYGAKAQIYKGYHEDELADADMWKKYRDYLSEIDAVTFGNTDVVLDDLADAPITWAGKSLNLGSKVALKFVFDPTGYEGNVSALTLKVSYRDIKNGEKTVVVEDPELYNEENGLYTFTVDSLLATELRTVVSAQIFAGETPVSATLRYGADTYGNNKEGALLDLCKALFAYSDSAKAYFILISNKTV